ncbi:MAG: hypothetical protein PVI23_02890 [Maricaulaceae bacterium]|jgi:hypothetical protein
MIAAAPTLPNMPIAVITGSLFLAVAAVFIAAFYFHYRFKTRFLDALQIALQNGSELTPDLARALEMRSDLRRGVVSLTRAAACILLGLAIRVGPDETGEAQAVMMLLIGLSAFPALFGLALIGFHIGDRRSNR